VPDGTQVHYVTARPEASRAATLDFLERHKLPCRANLHFCPNYKSSLQHKTEVMTRLAREFRVIVSIGDSDEDELASRRTISESRWELLDSAEPADF
jgi:hypothetical protein